MANIFKSAPIPDTIILMGIINLRRTQQTAWEKFVGSGNYLNSEKGAEMRLEIANIPEVWIIEPEVYTDERGFFMETFNQREMEEAGIRYDFVQDNLSHSRLGTLRGLHYQIQHPQGKLIRVLVGEIYNLALDMRSSSVTFGKWIGYKLSSESKKSIWVPPGFAHGLLALSPAAEVMYKTTDYYDPHSQRTVLWNDPTLGIEWPIPFGVQILLSERDHKAPPFALAEPYP